MGHPHRNNLYGLSEMLTWYGVENIAIRLEDKKQICDIETPFIAHAGNDFVLVKKICNGVVDYLWRGKIVRVDFEKFKDFWSGVLLVAEANENSIEPDYFKNRKKEIFEGVFSSTFVLFFGERLLYYTVDKYEDEDGTKEEITGSGSISRGDLEIDVQGSRFQLLNDMIIGSKRRCRRTT